MFRTSGSNFTRLQRCACAVVLIFGSMLVSISFYGLKNNSGFGVQIGQVSLSYAALIIGLEVAVAMTPITYLTNLAFRLVDNFLVEHLFRLPTTKDFCYFTADYF